MDPVLIASDTDRNAPGLQFRDGKAVEVYDRGLAAQLLAIPGFYEVIPDGAPAGQLSGGGRHEAPAGAEDEQLPADERTEVTEPAPQAELTEPEPPKQPAAKAAAAKTPAKSAVTES